MEGERLLLFCRRRPSPAPHLDYPGPPARDSREASGALASLQERLSRDARSGQEALMGAVKSELRLAVSALASEESAAIARLDARLSVSLPPARGCQLMYCIITVE
jgi:hypothetical protein